MDDGDKGNEQFVPSDAGFMVNEGRGTCRGQPDIARLYDVPQKVCPSLFFLPVVLTSISLSTTRLRRLPGWCSSDFFNQHSTSFCNYDGPSMLRLSKLDCRDGVPFECNTPRRATFLMKRRRVVLDQFTRPLFGSLLAVHSRSTSPVLTFRRINYSAPQS